MKFSKLFQWSIISALAGFLFGFDTVVISGAEKTLQSLWNSSDLFHGFVVVSMALWGTVIGAIFGAIPNDKLGRKRTLVFIGILYLISAIGSALAIGPLSFSFFRFIGGLGIGVSTIAVPTYITEISPAKNRGKLVGLYQFNLVFGMLIAFLSNYYLNIFDQNSWRYMMGVEAIPAFLYLGFSFFLPFSPRWLISKGENKEAEKILSQINSISQTKIIINEIENDLKNFLSDESIFLKKYRFILILAFAIAFFNQFSGINAVLYYAPRIFEETGLGKDASLFNSIILGVTNLIFTYLGVILIDRIGRKKLMLIGSIGYIISLTIIALSIKSNPFGINSSIFIFSFIASHAVGQGTVIWVFISEIFPNSLRSKGQAFGSSVHWVLAAIIPAFIPYLLSSIGSQIIFFFFAFMMFLQLLFVIFIMPETKGISIELLFKEVLNSKNKKLKKEYNS
ncbi:MAG: MFS transporter [Flavobacteriaceae bacterium]|nr:MFS transporter [Flavobacteriaceae bacterium]|tara:strand:- start:2638 stop:3993 length:1356 start_codon:yes stop_codon:yes gene_type:complete